MDFPHAVRREVVCRSGRGGLGGDQLERVGGTPGARQAGGGAAGRARGLVSPQRGHGAGIMMRTPDAVNFQTHGLQGWQGR
jgi:hypothetical protein